MKKTSGLLILLLLFIVGCAGPSEIPEPAPPAPVPAPSPQPLPTASPEYAERLARQFSPIFYLKGDGESTENFEPAQIEMMIDEALLREIDDPDFSEKATLRKLTERSESVYYLDIAELGPQTDTLEEYKLAYDAVRGRYKPTVYARVVEGKNGDNTVVQYWIFYYFNDWRNLHEGDWELVQLSFPAYTAKELLETGEQPIYAAYSQHQAGQRMSWADMKVNDLVEETHPIVYVARGSHANYFIPGNFWSGLDFDDTGLSEWQVIGPEQLNIVLLSEVEAEEEGLEWLGFRGLWGEYTGFSVSVLGLTFWQHGPLGPAWSAEEQRNKKWEYPNEWSAGLPEYPDPFWTAFFTLPGDWSKLAVFSLFSPANIHVYDSLGRHVGINENGEIEKQIPGALYITPEGTQYQTIIIPNADVSQEYMLIVEGTGPGKMDLKVQVPDAKNKVRRYLEYIDVPVSATTTARIKIMPDIPIERIAAESDSVRDTTTKLELDSDGDGTFELEGASGNFEKQKVIPSVLKAEVDIQPDTLDLTAVVRDKLITAYIELPEGYNPSGIDISTVRLMGEIPAWEGSIDIVDHDQDGIYELMVRFDRQQVIGYLVSTKQIEGEVSLTLTGVVDGRLFQGMDTILVTSGAAGQTQSD